MLNMIEYAGMYLKTQSAEYAKILNVSDAASLELEQFDKNSAKNTRKRGPSGEHFGIFFS